jgi:hypothetical protein
MNLIFLSQRITTKSNAQGVTVATIPWTQRMQNGFQVSTIDGETFKNADTVLARSPSRSLTGLAGILQIFMAVTPTPVSIITSDEVRHINQNNKYVDIVFISQNYLQNDLDKYHNDINRAIRYLIQNVEPFKSRREQFRFSYMDNLADLKCGVSQAHEFCDQDAINDLKYRTQIASDTMIVLVNQPNQNVFAETLPQALGVIFLPNNRAMEESVGHELGHSLADLRDEYYPLQDDYPITAISQNGVDRNCFKGTPPASSWNNLVGALDYAKGCGNPDYYRPYKENIMYNNVNFFDAPSQELLLRRIDALAGKSFDNEVPNIHLTSTKTNNDIFVKTQTSDNVGIIRVEFFKNGQLYHSEYVPPFTFNWNTSQEKGGEYNLTAKAYDANGNVATSNSLIIDINTDVQSMDEHYSSISTAPSKPHDYAKDIRNFIEHLFQ